ncbi:MAG: DUF1778 domain-containing protein [Hyphomicrobium sp.]|jgi:uncharacterized protein (DUF1778 family)|nr:DUF1778 domain-containing protein [Hyphomicrobium sp.]
MTSVSSRRPSKPGLGRKATKQAKEKAVAKLASSTINLRIDDNTHDLIERARYVLGQNRTEFMLNSARTHAQDVLLAQNHLTLSEADWRKLQKDLQTPTPPTNELLALMAEKPAWER